MAIYQYEKIGKGVANINEMLVSEFLIEGKNKALLMDTGMGIFNLKKYVNSKTNKDVEKDLIVVNSHFHPDHSNGNRKWKKVYIGEDDLPTFTKNDPYFKLVADISNGVYKRYPKAKLLKPFIKKVFMTKKGKTEYIPLHDGDKIELGDRDIIVKNFHGHTPGSITLLDPRYKTIYAGDACNMATWMITNPDISLHEYADTARAYYKDVKRDGYKKMWGSHVMMPNRISFIKDYAEWVDRLTPEKALLHFNTPGGRSELCIAVRPNIKHLIFACFYWAHQCEE